jgi:hypothetical protein
MFKLKAMAAGLSMAGAVMISTPAAADPIVNNAEEIRKLNIMLMVTSLRCRAGEHDFQPEYRLFKTAHGPSLAEADGHLKRQMNARYGEQKRPLDRIGVSIANTYGNGHPWMDCAGLKDATLKLTMSQDRQHLADMAGVLLADARPQLPAAVAEHTHVPANPALPPQEAESDTAKIQWWMRG